MIKSIVFALALLLSVGTMFAQDFVREQDKKTGKPLLRGKITFQNLLKESTCSWLEEGTQAYDPDKAIVEELSTVWKEYRFVIFAGTWCEDTHNLLPKFYKTMLEAGISPYSIEMYGVDRQKRTLQEENKFYKIERIPTIIVMHQKREVGRIIESVKVSIESDLLTIMEKDMKELELQKAERILQNEENRKAEIQKMTRKQRKRYYAPSDYY
jgi:thiol-disulfide isomerase/thioredoxin